MNTQVTQLIRSIRGVPLSVLLVFVFENRPIGHNFLVGATGYSKNAVTRALKDLSQLELIEPVPGERYNGWIMSDKATRVLEVYWSPNFRDSNYQFEALPDRSVDEFITVIDADDNRKMAVIRALHDAGIYGSAANKIALDPTITLDYVTEMIRENHSSPALLAKRILRHENE
jgi:predicted transcriptional regulator